MTLIPQHDLRLSDIAVAANAEHAATIEYASGVVAHALACGQLLIEARNQVPPGEWMRWIEENLDFTFSVSLKYVRLARHSDKINLTETTTIGGALAHLQSLNVPRENAGNWQRSPLSDSDIAEAKALRQQGMTVKAIAKEFGCNEQTIAVRLDPTLRSRLAARKKQTNARRRAAAKALKEQERHAGVAKRGGAPAYAYALLRKSAIAIDRAIDETHDAEMIDLLRRAMAFTHKAEDEIVFALKLERRTERQPLRGRAVNALQGRAPGDRNIRGGS